MNSMNMTGIGIHLKVADFDASRKFYESLGFPCVFAYGNEQFRESLPSNVANAPEKYRGMTFAISDSSSLEIAEGHIAVDDPTVFSSPVTSPKVSAMVKVETLEPLFSNSLVNIKFPVRHYYWNTLEAVVRDPDGFVLVFIAPFSEEELKRVQKHVNVEVIQPTQNASV